MKKCSAEQELTLNETVREAICLALIRLMEQKPFEKISVTEIVRVAGVGRTSFYRNFSSKEQVLCSHINGLYQQFYRSGKMPRYDPAGDVRLFLLPRFQFIQEHRDFFTVLQKHRLLYDVFTGIDNGLMLYINGVEAPLNQYRVAALSGSCAEIIRLWIANGFSETPEEMTDIFVSIFSPPNIG